MEIVRLQPCIELQLSNIEFKDILQKAKDWALMHGISMRPKHSYDKNKVEILPFTLLPSAFPRQCFKKVKNIQVLLNELMHKVAHNHDFLVKSLKSTIEADQFTESLFNIYESVYNEGFTQTYNLGLFRSDYMLHENQIKQVEFNTIASSFGGIVTSTTEYHKYILSNLGHVDKIKNIPENNPNNGLSKGLVRAWELYSNKNAIILFVVEDITYNICDQRFLEFEIQKINPCIKMIRRSLSELVSDVKLGPNKELIVKELEISVVYFRSGYQVEAYPTEREWGVRLLIERSRAIKCPSIQYHLAGTKKVQQCLSYPNALDIFIKNDDARKLIQEVFAGLYSLEFNNEAETIIDNAISEPEKYVLKPQREGGGNNKYNNEMKIYLESVRKKTARTAWILMDRLYPPVQKNYIVRATSTTQESLSSSSTDIITELGVYGVIIGDHENIIYNEEVGHILRSKDATENEGGIAAGIGAIDTPYLTP